MLKTENFVLKNFALKIENLVVKKFRVKNYKLFLSKKIVLKMENFMLKKYKKFGWKKIVLNKSKILCYKNIFSATIGFGAADCDGRFIFGFYNRGFNLRNLYPILEMESGNVAQQWPGTFQYSVPRTLIIHAF